MTTEDSATGPEASAETTVEDVVVVASEADHTKRPWWQTWPAIGIGFLMCFVPGVILLWLRKGLPIAAKVAVSVVALVAFTGLAATAGDDVDEPSAAAPVTTPSAPSEPSPSPTPDAPPSPSPSPTPDAAAVALDQAGRVEADDRSAYGTAAEAALDLAVKGRAPKTGYSRDLFGSGWVDVDQNGCDTRNDMLILRLENRDMSGTCKVMAGDLADPFTATWIHFERGGASEVDVDHLVALSDAWQKGAAPWEFAKRVAFANDPLNLEPVDASANRQKGDADAATWLPPNKAYRCHYVARQVAVKIKYELWVTQAELDAILRVLDSCPGEPLPSAGDQPVIAANTGGPPPAEKAPAETAPAKEEPAPKEVAPPKDELDERYPYCKDLPAGMGPYVKGVDPEYEWYRDGDGDGEVCE
jgi:hypothetical protein